MYFSTSSTELLKGLSVAKKAIKNNPVIPILENFLFEIKGSTLTITASDLQTSIITSLSVKEAKEGRIAVPARMLVSTLSLLPAKENVKFTFDHSTYSLTLTSSRGKYKLSCENAEDFPEINRPQKIEQSLTTTIQVLKKAFEQTMFAASQNESRPELDGVNIKIEKEKTIFSAIGDSQLARYTRDDINLQSSSTESTLPKNFTIPSRSLQMLVQLLSLPNIVVKQSMHIVFDENKVCFSHQNTHIIARLIESEFKPYESTLPTSTPEGKLNLHKETFLQALKMMEVYANKTYRRIKLTLSDADSFEISALDMNFANEAKEVHQCEYKGSNLAIGFDARLLITMVSKIVSTHITLHLYGAQKPVSIVPNHLEEHENLILLLAPMMLTETSF